MNVSGDPFLARTTLADDQHGNPVVGTQSRRLASEIAQGGRLAYQNVRKCHVQRTLEAWDNSIA